ncbi:hypothetical protein BJX66DRAFT_49554 [Aspergillus keveii]|uniref:Secreted protein n=1 Tax=Aspergillus keveii TaxID=714993 RepID=A0ABR4FRB3_9EURO
MTDNALPMQGINPQPTHFGLRTLVLLFLTRWANCQDISVYSECQTRHLSVPIRCHMRWKIMFGFVCIFSCSSVRKR